MVFSLQTVASLYVNWNSYGLLVLPVICNSKCHRWQRLLFLFIPCITNDGLTCAVTGALRRHTVAEGECMIFSLQTLASTYVNQKNHVSSSSSSYVPSKMPTPATLTLSLLVLMVRRVIEVPWRQSLVMSLFICSSVIQGNNVWYVHDCAFCHMS